LHTRIFYQFDRWLYFLYSLSRIVKISEDRARPFFVDFQRWPIDHYCLIAGVVWDSWAMSHVPVVVASCDQLE
jgi:hypothetical protein